MAEIAGLKLIVPSSVAGSGVSVSASGKVTFTAATTINVNGVFSATYDNYLVVISNVGSSSQNTQYRLRSSGSDASGSNYTRQYLEAGSTTVTGARQTSTTVAVLGYMSTSGGNGDHVYFYGPALAQPTAFRSVNVNSLSGAYLFDNACTHSLSTAYDGFTILPSVGNMTGALTVYGLSQ